MRQPGEPGLIIFRLGAAIRRRDIPVLTARLRTFLENNPGETVVCDTGDILHTDLAAVEALARLLLVTRQYGRPFRLRNANEALIELLALVGLADIVPLAPASALPMQGETEEREQPRGVEKEADPGDATG